MPDYAEFLTADGAVVRVEEAAAADPYGMQPVGRDAEGGVRRAADTFEQALGTVRTAAEAALAAFRGGDLAPDTVELEFRVRLSAEAGALIARTSADAHLAVRLVWSPHGEGPVR